MEEDCEHTQSGELVGSSNTGKITPKLNIKRQSRDSNREKIQEETKNCELWESGFAFLRKTPWLVDRERETLKQSSPPPPPPSPLLVPFLFSQFLCFIPFFPFFCPAPLHPFPFLYVLAIFLLSFALLSHLWFPPPFVFHLLPFVSLGGS